MSKITKVKEMKNKIALKKVIDRQSM